MLARWLRPCVCLVQDGLRSTAVIPCLRSSVCLWVWCVAPASLLCSTNGYTCTCCCYVCRACATGRSCWPYADQARNSQLFSQDGTVRHNKYHAVLHSPGSICHEICHLSSCSLLSGCLQLQLLSADRSCWWKRVSCVRHESGSRCCSGLAH